MSLGNHPNPALSSLDQERCERDLGFGVEVKFGLLDEYELAWFGGEKGDEDRKSLRDAEAYVGNVDEIARTTPGGGRQPTNADLNASIVEPLSSGTPC